MSRVCLECVIAVSLSHRVPRACSAWPLSRRAILAECTGHRLVLKRSSKPAREERFYYCVGAPVVEWRTAIEGFIVYEYIEGRPAADELIRDLQAGDIESAARTAFRVGEAIGRLHAALERCGPWPGESYEGLVRERCVLARRAGYRGPCPRPPEGEYTAASHGDLHLGQAIMADHGVAFVDAEGEPDTRVEPPPEYDLVAAARSAHYAAVLAGAGLEAASVLAGSIARGYCRQRGAVEMHPSVYAARALYEYYYELSRKTGLHGIPLESLRLLFRGREPVYGALVEASGSCV